MKIILGWLLLGALFVWSNFSIEKGRTRGSEGGILSAVLIELWVLSAVVVATVLLVQAFRNKNSISVIKKFAIFVMICVAINGVLTFAAHSESKMAKYSIARFLIEIPHRLAEAATYK